MSPEAAVMKIPPMLNVLGRRIARSGRAAIESCAAGAYLTDGRRLFRVVSQLSPHALDQYAALEDCRTLEVRPYRPEELYGMRLRLVRGAV
jgi:hypothetical protein